MARTIELSNKDRKILEKMAKYMKFFSFMYLTLWIIMCLILFTIIWQIFAK